MDDEDRYEENVAHFSTLDFPLTIWRAIELEKGQEPNWDKMGVHWTWVENSADTYFGSDSMWSPQDTPKPKNPILAIVKASLNRPDAVDWDSTLVANMVNPDENEVWLESGAQLQLLGVDYDGNGYKKPSIKSIRASTHTKEEGEHIVAVLRNTFPEMDIKLVGSVAAKGVSDKDFDILIMGEGFDEDSWQLLHDTFAGLGWVSQGPTGSRDSETETFSKGGQWLDLWFDEPPSHGKVGSAYPIPSLEDLLQYGGGLNEAQGHWNLITDECRKKEPNWDKLPKEEQEKRLDEEGMKWLARTWKEAEAKLRAFVFPLTVYRAICATEEVKTQNFGIYWAYDENSSYVDKELTGSCDDITIYRGVIPGPDSVDWMRTSWVALVAGDEFEINIRPGSKVGITGVKKHGESQWQESPLKSVTAAAVYLYHGTSETAYQQIMAKGGVMKPGYWGTEAIATYYAEVAAEELGPQEEYAIIKVPLSRFNKSQLIPDSASVAEPITGVLGRSDESLFEEWETSAGTWQDCLRIYGSVSYNASIKITPDSRIAAYAEAQNQSQHTDHTPHGMYKVLKSDPFAEEMALFAPRTNEPEKEEPAEPGATNPGGELRSLLTKSGAGTIMYMQADTRFRASISKGEGVYKTYLSPTEQAAVERGLGFMTKYLTEHPQKGRPAYERSIDIWRVKNVPEKVPESGYFVPGPGDMLLLKTVTVDERTKRQAVEDRTQTRLFAKGVALAHDKKRWMSGGCFLFAKALKERMPDAQYVGLWSEPEESYLHVGVKRGGKYYDIRGEQTEEQFVKPFWNQRHELRGPSEAEIDGGQGYAWKPNPKWPGGNELMSAQATMADAREAVEQAFPSFAANEDSD
jgi:hypothetical protein